MYSSPNWRDPEPEEVQQTTLPQDALGNKARSEKAPLARADARFGDLQWGLIGQNPNRLPRLSQVHGSDSGG